jgi:hypothetical protein
VPITRNDLTIDTGGTLDFVSCHPDSSLLNFASLLYNALVCSHRSSIRMLRLMMGADRPLMMAPLAAGLLPLLLLATVGADGQPGPIIGADGLQVVLDALLPRPLSVVFDGVNFTAAASNAPPAERGAPSSSTSASSGGGCVSNDTVANVGCWGASDGGPAAEKNVWGTGREVPQASTAEECCSLCANHSKCAAWTWNGPHGNLYCYGCECTRCPSARHCVFTI